MPGLNYFEAMDYPRMAAEYPIGPPFLQRYGRISRDELHAIQDARFLRCMARGWQTPFYRRLWGAKGIVPSDIRGIADIGKLPTYSKTDLMELVARRPPFGDFDGLDSYAPADRPPLILHTTSGTTGRPQPLLFGPWSRELQNLMAARIWLLQGVVAGDVMHSVYGHGMVNGGHFMREAALHWTDAIFMSAGTGIETRSVAQVQLMRDFGATVITGFGDYIRRLADVAREQGYEPGRDIPVRMISGQLGTENRDTLSRAWGGAETYDCYGIGDTGWIATELRDQTGLTIMEDGYYVELINPETGQPVGAGERGAICCTCLFKDDVYPVIRFNTCDVSEFLPDAAGLVPFRRIKGFLGRTDNMVKLRGINVYPTAIGAILAVEIPEANGEYICEVTSADGRDEMTVLIEAAGNTAGLAATCREVLRRRLGVEVGVVLHTPGALATLTGTESRQKPIRLLDNRKKVG